MSGNSEDANRAALDAIKSLTSRSTVVVLAEGRTDAIGSGILLKTTKGTPFLLTARHVLLNDDETSESWSPLALLISSPNTVIRDVGCRAVFAPLPTQERSRPIDVAIVLLKPEFHAQLRPLAVDLESVAASADIGEGDTIYMVGFPSYLGFLDHEKRIQQMTLITFQTFVKDQDRYGRLEIEWKEAIAGPGVRPYPHLQIREGVPMELGHPRGISGGGVWRVHPAKDGEIWSLPNAAKLIGVPVAFNERTTQYAETVTDWGGWLRKSEPLIDSGELR